MKKKLSVVVTGIIIIILIVGIGSIRKIKVVGDSMTPNVENNQILFMKKKFMAEQYKRFDIVLLQDPNELDKEIIKRIVALPNEKIYCGNSILYINDQMLQEVYETKGMTQDFGPFVLKDNEYFVIGDNREYSTDSRVFGPVSDSYIRAKYLY